MLAYVLTGFEFPRMKFAFVLLSALRGGRGSAEATALGFVVKGAMTVKSTIGGIRGGVIRTLGALAVVGTPCYVYGASDFILEASVAFAALRIFRIGLGRFRAGLFFLTGLALLPLLLFSKFLCGWHCHCGVGGGLCRLLICIVRVKYEDDEKKGIECDLMVRGVAKDVFRLSLNVNMEQESDCVFGIVQESTPALKVLCLIYKSSWD